MEQRYCVYVLRSFKDKQFYVGFTKNLPARVKAHNDGLIPSTRNRLPLQLVDWEGCLSQADATHREKYLKTAWRLSSGEVTSWMAPSSPEAAMAVSRA